MALPPPPDGPDPAPDPLGVADLLHDAIVDLQHVRQVLAAQPPSPNREAVLTALRMALGALQRVVAPDDWPQAAP